MTSSSLAELPELFAATCYASKAAWHQIQDQAVAMAIYTISLLHSEKLAIPSTGDPLYSKAAHA
eukprot:1161835-Pelagomonas_calceolata.AAC.13